MPETLRYVSRVARLPLLDSDGQNFGHVQDVVLAPAGRSAPRVLGFVTLVQRRRIFVNANRIEDLEATGVRMRTGTIDLRPFRKREAELLALEDLVGSAVVVDGVEQYVRDVGLTPSEAPGSTWELATLALGGRGPLARRRTPVIVSWEEGRALFEFGADAAEVAEMRDMRPADVANRIRALPLEKRQRLAEIMEDDRLADLLEELPEDEQIRLISGLDLERAADILEEMDPDDAADLLGEMSADERARLLEAMEPDDATHVRRLLTYESATAGGLMTPEPVIMAAESTVAEALAMLREASLPTALAAQVFVVNPPLSVPTGRFLGTIGFQRLLRHRPSEILGDIVPDRSEFLSPETPELQVAGLLAAYDMVAVAVCDGSRHLVGAVTIDDVMDHLLPEGWRRLLPRHRPGGRVVPLFRRTDDLTRPAQAGVIGVHFDPDAFGRFSEGIARFLGTGRFLAGQTVIVIGWIVVNVVAVKYRWDPYPFILLNLAFSTQAAYAAPLILLAQNRQDERDRAQSEQDREVNARTQAEAEFMARELASVRLSLADVATVAELRDAVGDLGEALARIESALDVRSDDAT